MMLVYVSGPYTLGDRKANVQRAVEVGNILAENGFGVFIPHLSHWWDKSFPHDWEFWMQQDLAILLRCDALVRIHGDSKGSDVEWRVAEDHGIPAIMWSNINTQAVMNWIKGNGVRPQFESNGHQPINE